MDDEPVKSKEPACKNGHFIDERHCIICSELLEGSSRGPSVKKPTSDGLRAVLDAACQRKDEVHELLSPVILQTQMRNQVPICFGPPYG